MNFTSTLLKIDLAVLSCILGVMALIYNSLKGVQKEAILAAQSQVKLEKTIEFHGKRLDNIESWISGNSGFKER